MRRLIALSIAIVILVILAITSLARGQTGEWEPVGEGIEYRQYQLPDPNKVYVARMDRSAANVTLETSIAQGRLVDGVETISSQADRYDQALNWWGEATIPHDSLAPGARNQVVVAINGTFSLVPDFQQPWEGQVHSGWYMWRFEDAVTRNAFVWKTDRSVFIGDCVRHPSSKQLVHYATGNTHEIDGVNVPRGEEQLIIYTAQYDRDTNTDISGTEVLVELTTPLLISHPEEVVGTVREIHNWQGSSPIPFDHVVLSASGQDATRLKNNVSLGDQIGISQYVRNCDDTSTYDWNNTFAGMVSNDFYFLKDGAFQHNGDPGAINRAPRTAVAFNEQYIYFIVVDGRYVNVSLGMTMEELANFALDELAADHGLSLDGGGSSTMVINGEVVNFPSDGIPSEYLIDPLESLGPRYSFALQGVQDLRKTTVVSLQVYLPLVGRSPDDPNTDPTPTPMPTPTPTPLPIVERPVPNGLMMVVVLSTEPSNAFQAGDSVSVNAGGSVNLRLGPGLNYGVLDAIPAWTSGVIQAHENDLNGVYAKGYYWWKVKFGDFEGWMAEPFLVKH